VLFESGTDLPLPNKSDIRVGRFDSVTNTSPDIDLTEVDSHKTTSRRHAKLMVEDGRVYVFEEIGTSNGTFVNGLRVSTGVKVEVKDGDWVQFGGVKTILRRA
jgi:pSer/pThr/pTyr-binding forkhead associated (FHA) protein